MLIDLDSSILESIVKEGVQEMIKNIAGRNAGVKKKGWFKTVKEFIIEYENKLLEEFLPVLVKDFTSKNIVKFSGGKMSQDDINKVKEFMEMLKKANLKKIEEDLAKNIDCIVVDDGDEEKKKKYKEVKRVVVEGHKWILRRLELYVKQAVSDTLWKNTNERSKIEVMLYNFTEGEVPEYLKKMFENGMDSVPSLRMTKKEVDVRVEEALLEYLTRLGRRRIYGYGRDSVVQADNVKEWVEKVKRIQGLSQESNEFVEKLENYMPALHAELDLVYQVVDIDSKEELEKKLEKEDCVLVLCDKGLGMSLFSLEAMRKADKALVSQLGAVNVEGTKEQIIESVESEIEQFERNLTKKQKDYLDSAYGGRLTRSRKKVSLPFLKSHHKIQKMTSEEIKNKDQSNLKFRPVVDAKQWLTAGYSGVVMQMMRQACDTFVKHSGSVMQKLKIKDGWRFSVEMRDYVVEEEYDMMVTADIQEAYSNIDDNMIKKAIEIVCGYVRFEEWTIDLMKKLVDLVLGQNYVETSEGVFQFRRILPMGYKLSGEALGIVALAEEIPVLYHLGDIQKNRVLLGELKDYPNELVENDVQREMSMSKGIKKIQKIC